MKPWALTGLLVIALWTVLSVIRPGPAPLTGLHIAHVIVLGIVEGITEFLPVSSTGHLVVTERLLGLGADRQALEALDSYAVIIQGGAILAVAWIFRDRLLRTAIALGTMLRLPVLSRQVALEDRRLAVALLIAISPAGILGVVAGDAVKAHLFSPGPIALAWAAGGLAILGLADRLRRRETQSRGSGAEIDQLSWQQAFIVGLVQAVALWPGMSRSLVTIVAGCLVGLSLTAAVELSFLLGFGLLLAASGYEMLRHGETIIQTFGWVNPTVGLAVAYLSALIAIRWLLQTLSWGSMAGFGWYRIGAALLTLGLLTSGRI